MQGCYSNKTLLERYFGFQMPCHFLTIPILKSMIREPSSGTYLSYRYSNAAFDSFIPSTFPFLQAY